MDPDGNATISLVTIALLIFVNALLTAGRTALTMLSDNTLKKMAEAGHPKARFIAKLLEKPAAFLEGVKLACFTCTAAASIALFFSLADVLYVSVRRPPDIIFDYPPVWLSVLITLAVVLVLNVLCLRLPYRIACHFPQQLAFALARFTWLAAYLFLPFAAVNGFLSRVLSHIFGVHKEEDPEQVTEEEIRMMVDVGNEKGAIEQSEKDMINNIFEFDDRNVSEVMTHRTDMTAMPKDASIGDIVSIAIETGYSRIPVYEDDIDDIMGIIYVKDLLCLIGQHEDGFDAQKYMRPALFVPENMSCIDLFAQFRQTKVMVAIAVDEYGGTAGIVSMEDLLESIVGNIQDEYDDEEEEISRIDEHTYSIDGTVSIADVERLFDCVLEDEDESEYDTIGGLLTEKLERIPAPDEHPSVIIDGVRFTVLLAEERRIARIRAERAADESQSH